jgi:crotonobetainyl-CoA:carnitine CoA-transferase CaiB-like acyl-CoA transferase
VPYQAFPTADGHIIVAIGNEFQFVKFCQAAGEPELAQDSRFLTNADRVRNRAAIVAEMQRLVKKRSTREWLEMLGPIGVPCGPINDMAQTFDHPQIRHRGMKLEMTHPSGASIPLVASPMRFTEHPIEYDRPPPMLGEHTREVLTDLLELDEAQIDSLRAAGIV